MLTSIAIRAEMPGDGETPPRWNPDRTRWHLLFPLGQSEQARFVVTDEVTGKKKIKRERITYTPEMLAKIEENFRLIQSHRSRTGLPPRPFPWSYHHAIEYRMFAGEDVDDDRLDRSGSMFDLHNEPEGKTKPAGLWALIEWTPLAWEKIANGDILELSPTTVKEYWTTDRTRFEGPVLVGGGLVDVGAIDTIGTARDGLPEAAFRSAAERLVAAGWSRRVAGDLGGGLQDGAVVEMAVRAMLGEEFETQPVESGEAGMTPEEKQAFADELKATFAQQCADFLNSDAFKSAIETATRACMTERAVQPPVAGATEEKPAESDAPVEVEIEMAAKKASADGYRIATRAAQEEATGLVRERKLRPSDIVPFITRRVHGDDVSTLLGDYGSLAAPAGAPGVTTGGAPAGNGVATRRAYTETDVVAEMRRHPGYGKVDPRIIERETRARLVSEGHTIVDEADDATEE